MTTTPNDPKRYEGRIWNGTEWVRIVTNRRFEYVIDTLMKRRVKGQKLPIRVYDHFEKKIVRDISI